MKTGRLLINWVYHVPVGHAIEGFRVVKAFRNCNPDLEIGILLNAKSAWKLAECVDEVDEVYPVCIEGFEFEPWSEDLLTGIPREWDYVYTDPRHFDPVHLKWPALAGYERAIHSYLRTGSKNDRKHPDGKGAEFPSKRFSRLHLRLPQSARQFADHFLTPGKPVRISLLFGAGTEPGRTPPMSFWRGLIQRLIQEHPDIEFVCIGMLDKEKYHTKGVSEADVEGIVQEFPQILNAYDKGLVNQLAIAERCHLHISPHSGMSFAVQCLGVPWLVLSGTEYVEEELNGVPFICIYPTCKRYPCGPFNAPNFPLKPECLERRQRGAAYPCLDREELFLRMTEILAAARQLLRGEISFHDCVQTHYAEITSRLQISSSEPYLTGWPEVLSPDFNRE